MISLRRGEDEAAQGQTIRSGNLNQEEVLKPPILCGGRAAAGLRGIHTHSASRHHGLFFFLHPLKFYCLSAPQQPEALT